jgi:hypothetical protein
LNGAIIDLCVGCGLFLKVSNSVDLLENGVSCLGFLFLFKLLPALRDGGVLLSSDGDSFVYRGHFLDNLEALSSCPFMCDWLTPLS